MCGISGWFMTQEVSNAQRTLLAEFAHQAMGVGEVRGTDSTGIAIVDRETREVEVAKSAVPGTMFAYNPIVKRYLWDLERTQLGIIHNRKATYGKPSNAAAHPFTYGDITLVHNGTLTSYGYANPGGENYLSDSDWLCHQLATKADTKALLEDISGSFVLVWFNAADNTFNIARNPERPMSIGKVKDSNILLYASEYKMLMWLARRNSITLDAFIPVPEDSWLSWDATDGVGVEEYKQIDFVSDYTAELQRPKPQRSRISNFRQPVTAGVSTHSSAAVNAASAHVGESSKPRVRMLAQTEILNDLNLHLGETTYFVTYDWEHYSVDDSLGALKGIHTHSQFESIAYNIPQPSVAESQGCLYKGTIVAARWENEETKWPVLIINEIHKVEEDWWDSDDAVEELANEVSEAEETVLVGEASEGTWMSKKEWNTVAARGCDYCSVGFMHPREVVVMNRNTYVCEGCAEHLVL